MFLLQRPIGVLMTFFALAIFSLAAFFQLPISLLPDIDIPKILVKVEHNNASPAEIEQNLLRPLRNHLLTLHKLKDMDSKAVSQAGFIELEFEYGTNMTLAYLEVSEKIDKLVETLPKESKRPSVVRMSTADIPLLRVHIIPKNEADLREASQLADKVIKKRFEGITGVALTDINGLQKRLLAVRPQSEKINALGISLAEIVRVVEENNRNAGLITVKDGQYEYQVKIAANLYTAKDLENLTVRNTKGSVFTLKELAEVKDTVDVALAYHHFNGKKGIVINIHKQENARMTELMPLLDSTTADLRAEFPQFEFFTSENQSLLLHSSIESLLGSLFFGGLFAFLVLFLFLKNRRIPFIIGISLPLSVLLCFLFFYLFDLSINIISLSGLALGLGMQIDNAIIVTDSIAAENKTEKNLLTACYQGTKRVFPSLLGSVLTTLAVFLPLIFLSGIAGALFYDQAVAVAIILSISLLISGLLVPLLYRIFLSGQSNENQSDALLYLLVEKIYKRLYVFFLQKSPFAFVLMLLLPFSALFLMHRLPKANLPEITKTDFVLKIDWNAALSAAENEQYVSDLYGHIAEKCEVFSADIGIPQYLMSNTDAHLRKAEIYVSAKNADDLKTLQAEISDFLSRKHRAAVFEFKDAQNAFYKIFARDKPYLDFRFRNSLVQEPIQSEILLPLFADFTGAEFGAGLSEERNYIIRIKTEELALRGINYQDFLQHFKLAVSPNLLTEVKLFGENFPVKLLPDEENFGKTLSENFILAPGGTLYPVSNFIEYRLNADFKAITADKSGVYQNVFFQKGVSVQNLTEQAKSIAVKNGYILDIKGEYLSESENFKNMILVLLMSVLLLYFILVAQFESFLQPFMVLLTLPLGIGGALLLLYLAGQTLNIMSLIGMVIMLGIMINDAILKIDTINELREKMPLSEALAKAGIMRLRSILMTSITTILAVFPVLLSSGIGAELQKPLVLGVVGGLSVGTFTALYFVPFLFSIFSRTQKPKR
jgi:multidrug efflux pump subunit AcrB